MPVALQVDQLSFAYRPGQPVLHEVNLRVDAGQFTAVLGPNGSGKSTLLKCLLGRLATRHGQIHINGQPLAAYRSAELAQQIAYVPQSVSHSLAFTVREVVLTGRFAHGQFLGLANPNDTAVAQDVMRQCGVDHLADRLVDELSGGEAQCVMIARALAQQPRLLLLDEPTSHLDLHNQASIYRLMQSLAREQHMAVLCVSHDVNLAARFADQLLMMNQGRRIALGPPADAMTQENLEATYETDVQLLEVVGQNLPMVVAK